jgi:hypothetical protein
LIKLFTARETFFIIIITSAFTSSLAFSCGYALRKQVKYNPSMSDGPG